MVSRPFPLDHRFEFRNELTDLVQFLFGGFFYKLYCKCDAASNQFLGCLAMLETNLFELEFATYITELINVGRTYLIRATPTRYCEHHCDENLDME